MASPEAARVLCVAGSPRRHGSSETLLDACIGGIERRGGCADKLVVAESGVAACRGCNACSKTGVCRLDDSMGEIYARIDAADAIVVASPVYFASVPAVLKALYDRCQPYWARAYVLGQPRPARRPAGVLLVRSGGDPFGFDGALLPTRSVSGVLALDIIEEVLIEGIENASELREHPDVLERAAGLGESLVARVIERRTS